MCLFYWCFGACVCAQEHRLLHNLHNDDCGAKPQHNVTAVCLENDRMTVRVLRGPVRLRGGATWDFPAVIWIAADMELKSAVENQRKHAGLCRLLVPDLPRNEQELRSLTWPFGATGTLGALKCG